MFRGCFHLYFGERGFSFGQGNDDVLVGSFEGDLLLSGGRYGDERPACEEVHRIVEGELAGGDGGAVVLREGDRQATVCQNLGG